LPFVSAFICVHPRLQLLAVAVVHSAFGPASQRRASFANRHSSTLFGLARFVNTENRAAGVTHKLVYGCSPAAHSTRANKVARGTRNHNTRRGSGLKPASEATSSGNHRLKPVACNSGPRSHIHGVRRPSLRFLVAAQPPLA